MMLKKNQEIIGNNNAVQPIIIETIDDQPASVQLDLDTEGVYKNIVSYFE